MTTESTVRVAWAEAEAPPEEAARPVPVDAAEALERLRESSAAVLRRSRERARLTTGLTVLDGLLGGGWSSGRIGELVGAESSGATGIAVATAAAATGRGEVVAWIDGAGAFDPASAAAAGVDLERVLWARPHGAEESVRAAELVLETGGFTVVVVDLVGVRGGGLRRVRERRGALRLRLARAVERAGAVGLVLARRPWVGTMAGTTLRLDGGRPLWGGCGAASRWLAGLQAAIRVERGRLGETGRAVSLALAQPGAAGSRAYDEEDCPGRTAEASAGREPAPARDGRGPGGRAGDLSAVSCRLSAPAGWGPGGRAEDLQPSTFGLEPAGRGPGGRAGDLSAVSCRLSAPAGREPAGRAGDLSAVSCRLSAPAGWGPGGRAED